MKGSEKQNEKEVKAKQKRSKNCRHFCFEAKCSEIKQNGSEIYYSYLNIILSSGPHAESIFLHKLERISSMNGKCFY
jgi:hypothetical protein